MMDNGRIVEVSQEVKNLGSKARARLEEVKSKRREIRLLDATPTTGDGEDPKKQRSKTGSFLQNAPGLKGSALNRKRKSGAVSRQSPSSKSIRRGSRSDTSSWIPDISHIESPKTKDDRSNVVKMHGIPRKCTAEQILKFFTGLQVERISILLPNMAPISFLDASNPPPASSLSTCETCNCRVLVQFQSSPAALLASERSGETMRVTSSASNAASYCEYVIAVSVVPKKTAKQLSFLVSKHLMDGLNCIDLLTNTLMLQSRVEHTLESGRTIGRHHSCYYDKRENTSHGRIYSMVNNLDTLGRRAN